MNTQERIEKMLKKSEKILQAGKSKKQQLRACPYCGCKYVWNAYYTVYCVGCGKVLKGFEGRYKL